MYTKGEWIVDYNGTIGHIKAVLPERASQGWTPTICRYDHCAPSISIEEAKANASLIVAAVNACAKVNPDNPMAVAGSISEMYEALRNLVKRIDDGVALGEALDILPARLAIAKAEGKE